MPARAFVAVFLPPGVQQTVLEAALEAGRSLGDRIRWTRPENVHLTLKFLGDVPEEKLDDVSAALRGLCAGHAPFDACISGFGAFPSARRARILWAGVSSEAIVSLAADIDAALEPLGFEREGRPYLPHATLGRVRGRPARVELPPTVPGELVFQVRRVELVESTLTAGGPLYETIESIALEGFRNG